MLSKKKKKKKLVMALLKNEQADQQTDVARNRSV
jgi:hypothetical protein